MTEGLPQILSDGTNSYIYGPGGLPVEQISGAETPTYLHHDQQGSIRLLTGSAGTVTGKCTYGAYGTPTCEGTTTTPLGYDGQYTSSDTGFIYLRARVYDPATAQFLTVDPMANLTRAPYYYVGDNPLNKADPTGLMELSPCENRIEYEEKEKRIKQAYEEKAKVENELEEKAIETEEEERKEIVKRCVAGVALDGIEGKLASGAGKLAIDAFTVPGAIAGCAAGIYEPAIVSGIKSLIE